MVIASDDPVQVPAVPYVSWESHGNKSQLTRDEKIIAFLKSKGESFIYFLILDMRLFSETECPLSPEDLEEEDSQTLLNLYTHLEEYEKCQIIHATKLTA